MSAYQNWCEQKENLRESLRVNGDGPGATSLLRHALAQVEQNTMAVQPDDLLRQQTGILFSCFKTALNLLDISVTSKVWVAQSQAEKPKGRPAAWWLFVAVAMELGAGLLAYFGGQTLTWIAFAAALVCTFIGWLALRRAPATQTPEEDRLKVTARPDTEKLFQAIDAQMKAIDRFVNDFTYLNEQNALQGGAPDPKTVPALAELLEAVCECEGEAGEEATLAAERLIADMGARAVPYSPEEARLFNLLPSVDQTRTLAPALVSLKDGALLYRGTAAVRLAAAQGEAPAAPGGDGAET
jgi:hypothetical protein